MLMQKVRSIWLLRINFQMVVHPWKKAGVYMTDRDTVNKVERMKVTTCLNPLHTALAVYGVFWDIH